MINVSTVKIKLIIATIAVAADRPRRSLGRSLTDRHPDYEMDVPLASPTDRQLLRYFLFFKLKKSRFIEILKGCVAEWVGAADILARLRRPVLP